MEAEARVVLAALPAAEPVRIGPYRGYAARTPGAVTVLAGGVGPAAAGAATAAGLALCPQVRLVLSAGIAGGFEAGGIRVGDLALATVSRFADLGADSPDGFRSGADLGWGAADYPGPPALLTSIRSRLSAAGLTVHSGTVITVSTVTGTAARAAVLRTAHQPVAEAMEGAAVAAAADRFGRDFLELRAVSNLVGDRDRDAWDVPGALLSLRLGVAAAMPALLDTAS